MSELDEQIALASKLPLLDAAYGLWRFAENPFRRSGDDAFDYQSPPSRGTVDVSTPASFAENAPKVFRRAIETIKFREENAHQGPAFHWLKRAHPDTGDGELQQAIRIAVKFDKDCARFFTYSNKGNYHDVEAAIQLASRENPGFTEPTLKSAHQYLAYMMR